MNERRRYNIHRLTENFSHHYKVVYENSEELFAGRCSDQILPALMSIRIRPYHSKLRKEKKLMRFNARFHWLLDEKLRRTDERTIIYAGLDILSSGRRRDTNEIREKRCQIHSCSAFIIKPISFILTLKFKLSTRTIQ